MVTLFQILSQYMLPKSSKHYIQPTADLLNIDQQLVEDLVSFYYSRLRKALSELEAPQIRVENIGTFKAKNKKLKELYVRYSKHLEVTSSDTIKQMRVKKRTEQKLERVMHIQNLINEERKRRNKFLKEKYESSTKTKS